MKKQKEHPLLDELERKKRKARPTEKYGQYEVSRSSNGKGFTVKGPGIREKGVHVPPDNILEKKYDSGVTWYGKEGKRRPSSLRTELRYRAVIIGPDYKPSMPIAIKALRLGETFGRIPKQDIIDFLRKHITEKRIEAFMKGKAKLPTIEQLRKLKGGEKLVHSSHRGHGGFEVVLQEAFPQYPRLYDMVYNRSHMPEDLNPKLLARDLTDMFFTEGDISSTGLRHSKSPRKRILYSRVLALAHNGYLGIQKKRRILYTQTVEKLTGLSAFDIEVSKWGRKDIGTLTESFVQALANRGADCKLDLSALTDGNKLERNGVTQFYQGKRTRHADFRVKGKDKKNIAIEVKAGRRKITPKLANEIISLYKPGLNSWASGEPIEASKVLFFMMPHLYEGVKGTIEEAGIQVIPHSWFSDKLHTLVERMKTNPEALKSLTPRLHDLDYLLRLDKELLERPIVLARSSNIVRRIWTKRLLMNLAEPQETQDYKETIDQLVQGNIVSNPQGQFLLLERNLGQLTEDPDYFAYECKLREAAETIAKAQEHNNNRIHVPKGRLAFLDIETCGLRSSDPIFSISVTEPTGDDLKTTCLVARDYSGEEAMLAYLLSILPNYSGVYTFNGASFDLPRLETRFRANGLRTDGGKTLKEKLGENHVDLYQAYRPESHEKVDRKLQTFEMDKLGLERKDDISGARVSEAYIRYVNRTWSTKKLAKAVNHNMMDTNTLVGILAHCLKQNSL